MARTLLRWHTVWGTLFIVFLQEEHFKYQAPVILTCIILSCTSISGHWNLKCSPDSLLKSIYSFVVNEWSVEWRLWKCLEEKVLDPCKENIGYISTHLGRWSNHLYYSGTSCFGSPNVRSLIELHTHFVQRTVKFCTRRSLSHLRVLLDVCVHAVSLAVSNSLQPHGL